MKHKAVMLWVLLGVVGLAMVAGVAAVVLPSGYVDDEVIITIIIVGAYALGGMLVVAVGGRMRRTMWLCVASLLVSMLIFVTLLWGGDFWGWRIVNRLAGFGTVFLVTGVVFMHRLLVFPLQIQIFAGKLVQRVSLISTAFSGVLVAASFALEGTRHIGDVTIRLMGISLIVSAGSTIATGAFALFGPKPGDDEPGLLAGSIPVSLSCPRCADALTVQSNREGRCEGCRLKVRVEVEEPRCGCGYLLYELESDTCPECGKAIPADDRWAKKA